MIGFVREEDAHLLPLMYTMWAAYLEANVSVEEVEELMSTDFYDEMIERSLRVLLIGIDGHVRRALACGGSCVRWRQPRVRSQLPEEPVRDGQAATLAPQRRTSRTRRATASRRRPYPRHRS